jgi:uncharacterized protein
MGRLSLTQWIFGTIGMVALGLGIIGIIVPLVPTTPFLLLAAACFMRSSNRLYNWLINHKWFGSYIKHYQEHRAISRRARILALVLLWAAIGYASFYIVTLPWLRFLLLVIAAGVSIYLLRLKTLTAAMISKSETRPTAD